MKRFLYRDHSGRGFVADWRADEIIAECADGGTFADFAHDDDDGDSEGLLSWLDRCGPGDEFTLDGADLVCVADDHEPVAARVRFSVEPQTEWRCRYWVRDDRGNVIGELVRHAFGNLLDPPTVRDANARWDALVSAVARD